MPEITSAYQTIISGLHRELGIPRDYSRRGFPLQPDCADLVTVPYGPAGEIVRVTHTTAYHWSHLKSAATDAGINIAIRSGYRSPSDQAELIRTELAHSGDIHDVLRRVLAPGFSEHHTGNAVDIALAECSVPLPEIYESTRSFLWLQENTGRFGFSMSYPRNNPSGLIYEPWHWKCDRKQAS